MQAAIEARPQTSKTSATTPLIELMSLAPGGGKTHLLYHLSGKAALPKHLGGRQTCVVVIDTDGTFSVPRLAAQIQTLLRSSTSDMDEEETKDVVLTALHHIHIFRPQSLASATATLDALPTYLFDRKSHQSFDRALAFIAIDSASAFYWQDRVETEDAAFLAVTSVGSTKPPPAQPSGYTQLASSLKSAVNAFRCQAIITTWHLGPIPQPPHHRSFRPVVPALQPTLRLVVHRLPVRKLPLSISVQEALREAENRQKAVVEGKFECFVNEWGVDGRMLQALQRLGVGFGFGIVEEGLLVEGEEGG